MKGTKTIYDVAESQEKKNIINGIRNAVTTLAAVTVAAWICSQGDASTGYRVTGMVGLFVLLKWLALDTWDYVGNWIQERRWKNDLD